MKKQIRKIYVLPTFMGAAVAVVYQFMILWGNDGVVKCVEEMLKLE